MRFSEYINEERVRGVISLPYRGTRAEEPSKTVEMLEKKYNFYKVTRKEDNDSSTRIEGDVCVRLDNDSGYVGLNDVEVDFDKMKDKEIEIILLNELLSQLFLSQMYNVAMDLNLLSAANRWQFSIGAERAPTYDEEIPEEGDK